MVSPTAVARSHHASCICYKAQHGHRSIAMRPLLPTELPSVGSVFQQFSLAPLLRSMYSEGS